MSVPAKLFYNAKVFTAKKGDDSLYQAVLVNDGKVLFVGDESGARAVAQQHNLTVVSCDMFGKVVLPAFLDGHTHLVITGMGFAKLDVRGMKLDELQSALKRFRQADPNTKVLLCKGFRPDELDVVPDRKYLDEVVGDIPVFIDTSSIHGCWVNSAGLKAIGVDENTVCPEGGEIVKEADGRVTGFLHETAFHNIVWPYLGRTLDIEDRVQAIERMCQAYLAAGTVGAVEMALFPEDLAALEECYRRNGGKLPIRLACHWLVSPDGTEEDRLNRVREAEGHKRRLASMAPWLKVVGIKVLGDGIVDTCTAFLTKPYANGSMPGPIWPPSKLFPVVDLADALDLQIAIHAIGDAAIDNALDALEHAVETNGPKADRRNRIEHLEMVTSAAVKRLTRLGIIASLQPTHADPASLDNYLEMLGGDERVDRLWPTTEYVEAGSHVAFGSDPPSAPYPALPNLYSATTRKSLTKPHHCSRDDARVLALEKYKLPLEASIRSYSLGTAYSTRDEKQYGSLEEGKQADFCVLDIDPWTDGVMGLREAQEAVGETWMSGERVWVRGGVLPN